MKRTWLVAALLISASSFADSHPKPPTAPAVGSALSSSSGEQAHPAIDPGEVPQASPVSTEDWKGKSPTNELEVGGLTGLGIFGNQAGYSVLGTIAKPITRRGFVSDVNDSVSIEGAAGAIFVAGTGAFMYGAHLRWDFQKDSTWTFYALGGVGGFIAPSSISTTQFLLFPRFGAGVLAHVWDNFAIRGEISHELIGVGVVFPL